MDFNSKDNVTKQIVAAHLQKNDNTAGNNKSIIDKDPLIGKNSSISLSDEFLLFWGNNLDSAWFQGKRKVSPFLIVIFLLVATILYLCFNLLFSPSEIEQIFFDGGNSNSSTISEVKESPKKPLQEIKESLKEKAKESKKNKKQ